MRSLVARHYLGLTADNNVRADSSLEKLAKLKPSFREGRHAHRGQLDAAHRRCGLVVLLGSEDWARSRGLPIQAYLSYGKAGAVDFVGGEGLLMAPAFTVPRMLADAGLTLQDFDFYEIHEAFAAQVRWHPQGLGVGEVLPRAARPRPGARLDLDRAKLNIKGGSVAVGHPFAATGARIVGTLAKLLATRGSGRGLISVCTAGGMGVTAIMER